MRRTPDPGTEGASNARSHFCRSPSHRGLPGRGGLRCARSARSALSDGLEAFDAFLWGPWLLIPLLLGTGVVLTIRLRGLQLRKLGPALRFAFLQRDGGGEDASAEGDISHYQALTTALAATVGVGNIVGVATAIHLGGPGALF